MTKKLIPALLALALLAGCGTPASPAASSGDSSSASSSAGGELEHYLDRTVVVEEIEIENEAVALSSSPAAIDIMLLPEASGKATKSGKNAVIDYSNTGDGYVMVQYTAASDKRLKVQVTGPSTTYTYDLPAQSWATFPLSDGNGNYKVTALQNTEGKKYAVLTSASFSVTLKDEFAPYVRPNQYVDYSNATNTVAKAEELTSGVTDPLKKVEKIYDFVVKNLTYDKDKAATVQSGYLPVLDNVLSAKKGICFDYASLMAGMLRAEGVPCKLVVGYAGKAYHAWISVWTEASGWIDGIIYFDGTAWQRMDPTFASSSNASEAIMEYIGDGSNYTVKYLY